jgi:hypothetical protein
MRPPVLSLATAEFCATALNANAPDPHSSATLTSVYHSRSAFTSIRAMDAI